MEKKRHHVYNLMILDESGSMEDIKNATIRGFNEVVETIKDVESKFPEQRHFISLVSFNGGGVKEILWNEEVKKLHSINGKLYQPAMSTPLYDAIGKSVSRLREELPADVSSNVLVTILTDGEENASREYSRSHISALINELKSGSWTFAYIGANHDVEKAARNISIKNYLHFEANEKEMAQMFKTEKEARLRMSSRMANMVMSEPVQFNDNFYKEEEEEKEV